METSGRKESKFPFASIPSVFDEKTGKSSKAIGRYSIFERLPFFPAPYAAAQDPFDFVPDPLMMKYGTEYVCNVVKQLGLLEAERKSYETIFNCDVLADMNKPSAFAAWPDFVPSSKQAFREYEHKFVLSFPSTVLQEPFEFKPEDLVKLVVESELQITYLAGFVKRCFDILEFIKNDIEARNATAYVYVNSSATDEVSKANYGQEFWETFQSMKDIDFVFGNGVGKTDNKKSDIPFPSEMDVLDSETFSRAIGNLSGKTSLYKSMDHVVRILISDVQCIKKNVAWYLKKDFVHSPCSFVNNTSSGSTPQQTKVQFNGESRGPISLVPFYLHSMTDDLKHARFGLWSIFNALQKLKGKPEVPLTGEQIESMVIEASPFQSTVPLTAFQIIALNSPKLREKIGCYMGQPKKSTSNSNSTVATSATP